MKYIKHLILLICLSTMLAATITVDEVKSTIAKVDIARSNININELINIFSDDINITINVLIDNETRTMSFDKDTYINMLKNSWAKVTNYSYTRSNEIINIVDNQVNMTSIISESMMSDEHNISSMAEENSTLELIDDNLMITNIIINLTI